MLVSILEREKNPTDAFVEYKSKIVAGLMIFFFFPQKLIILHFWFQQVLLPPLPLSFAPASTWNIIPLLSYNVRVQIIDPNAKSGVSGHSLSNRMPGTVSSEKTAIF